MALRQLPPLLNTLLPAANAPIRPIAIPLLRRLHQPLFESLRIPISLASVASIPSLLGDIWESVLRAVPKKKTSHMKKRHRFMAGKGLKDVTALNRCSGCGNIKLANHLCPYCVESIKQYFKRKLRGDSDTAAAMKSDQPTDGDQPS
ncbi:uncharacterized protein BDZ99DRAFT_443818 [Mytilinidion resinicola]|uniref:Large ribosomal subunit protein bL32m n=1 Tax=Mytilinidion resinicola TaxID=574789 RepID=A0A6A6YNF4_9PEZI|nr:uncharacterized protein BDZ99DRAFT_443818 [Mytilinidion resinicola]KAF2809505.1 hypothetical protein BDZ99DRAFT_443818 [Mytilinidion resinicola]